MPEALEQLPRQRNADAVRPRAAAVALNRVHAARLLTDDARKTHTTHNRSPKLHRSDIAYERKSPITSCYYGNSSYILVCHGQVRVLRRYWAWLELLTRFHTADHDYTRPIISTPPLLAMTAWDAISSQFPFQLVSVVIMTRGVVGYCCDVCSLEVPGVTRVVVMRCVSRQWLHRAD